MSYVTQNFYSLTSTNRLTYRRYFHWLSRNTASIWLLFNYLNSSLNQYLNPVLNFRYFPALLTTLFSQSLSNLFTKNAIKWRPIRENQWIRGTEYWTYRTFLNTMEGDVVTHSTTTTESLSSSLFYNQQLLEKKYTLISLFQKYYRFALVNFLHFLLRPWQYWRHQLSYNLDLLLLTNEFYILRFLNTRLFKVYYI
jgi:hypothetical protein